MEDNPGRGGVAGVPIGQNSGEGHRLKRARRCQDHGCTDGSEKTKLNGLENIETEYVLVFLHFFLTELLCLNIQFVSNVCSK